MNFYKKTISFFLLVGFLSGCVKYQTQDLESLFFSQEIKNKHQEKVDLFVACKPFDQKDSFSYLGRNLLDEGILPIQVTVQNFSSDSFLFSQNFVEPKVISTEKVVSLVKTSTLTRGVPAFLLSPGLFLSWGAICNENRKPGVIAAGCCSLAASILSFLPAYTSFQANHTLKKDYACKAPKFVHISPETTVNFLVFIENKKPLAKFSLSFVNQKTKEKKSFYFNC